CPGPILSDVLELRAPKPDLGGGVQLFSHLLLLLLLTMLIKEYRIPMPLSVDEYRIAQLYMIQSSADLDIVPLVDEPYVSCGWILITTPRETENEEQAQLNIVLEEGLDSPSQNTDNLEKKSREESEGEGSGVEILENRPYTDGPGGTGQYTHKVYHIGQHIPSWFRSILPKAALRVEEESWNAYPYTRTRYTCPFVEKFSIDIETYYKPDTGCQNDVFNLSTAEKRQRDVDPIDIVKDLIAPHEYLVEEDPRLYRSTLTQRGPLSEDWIQEIRNAPEASVPVMCAYKLCKVEFRYWGMQSKIERFIHDVGLRKVMVRAHRQAWCWQDEWYGLTIEDIRQLERETQLALAQKMNQYNPEESEGATAESGAAGDKHNQSSVTLQLDGAASGASTAPPDTLQTRGELNKQWSTSSRSSRSSKRGGSPSRHSLSEWRMQSIARDSEESTDDEFFDAHVSKVTMDFRNNGQKLVLKEHADDDAMLAISGLPVVRWPKTTGRCCMLMSMSCCRLCAEMAKEQKGGQWHFPARSPAMSVSTAAQDGR
ncbi:hypothetical protein DNTS_032826, partial [Danionella cerebrum]